MPCEASQTSRGGTELKPKRRVWSAPLSGRPRWSLRLPGARRSVCIGFRREAAAELECLLVPRAAWGDLQIVDRRRDAQSIAGLQDVQRLWHRGKVQHDRAPPHAGAGIVGPSTGRAQSQPVCVATAVTVAAIQAGQRERRRGAQTQAENRIVKPGFVGQQQAEDDQTLVGQRLMQHHEIGLLIRAIGTLHRPDFKVLAGQGLAAGRIDPRQLAQFEGEQAGPAPRDRPGPERSG